MATNPASGDDHLKPTFEKHLDAIKWVIGLPVAILFGTTQFAEKIDFARHAWAVLPFECLIVVNASAIALGIWYYFGAIKRADLKSQGHGSRPTAVDSFSFYGGFVMVAVGFVLAVAGLMRYPGLQFPKDPPPPATSAPAPHFAIFVSGPVRDRAGAHVHTFLLNETTGEIWRMQCSTPTDVQFSRVPVR